MTLTRIKMKKRPTHFDMKNKNGSGFLFN